MDSCSVEDRFFELFANLEQRVQETRSDVLVVVVFGRVLRTTGSCPGGVELDRRGRVGSVRLIGVLGRCDACDIARRVCQKGFSIGCDGLEKGR